MTTEYIPVVDSLNMKSVSTCNSDTRVSISMQIFILHLDIKS